jgi:hypothetical protein
MSDEAWSKVRGSRGYLKLPLETDASVRKGMKVDSKREMLRHCLATLAYRGDKVLRDAPDEFANYRANETTRTPAAILAHLGDLIDWALTMAREEQAWQNSDTLPWQDGANRFFASLTALDDYLASSETLGVSEEKLFQGPIADALTHVGQLAMLRRMAGSPIRGENYFKADIEIGRVGAEQTPPRVEFD